MITFTRAYVANINGTEKVFASLKEAQAAELAELFTDEHRAPWTPMEIANYILDKDNADKLQAILTLSDSSRPRARGKSKPRKATTAPPELPLEKGKAA